MSAGRLLALLWAFVGVALAFYGLHVYREANRFVIVGSGKEALVYKLDRKTGETWMLIANEASKVEERQNKPESAEERSIALVREWRSDLYPKLREVLANRKGKLRIYGWKARKVGEQTYLVSFTFDAGDGTEERGIYFEANLIADVARLVNGDPELETIYNVKKASVPTSPEGVPDKRH